MPKAKRLPVRVICAQCPYCDGENVLGSVGPAITETSANQAREIACKHCQSLFTLSEAIIRIRNGFKEKLSATDAAA